MVRFIKKNQNFLYWALMPSLLLVLSVFGVNFISRPVYTQAAPECTVADDCNNNTNFNPNGCRIFQCTSNECDPAGIDLSQPGCGLCNGGICNNNGVCDQGIENSNNCPGDCFVVIQQTSVDLCVPVLTTAPVAVPQGLSINPCSGSRHNYCCPQGCVGDPADTSLFDIDCACCGDSLTGTGEQCDPTGATCTVPGDGAGTCDGQCQCTPSGGAQCGNGIVETGETCEPPNTATCDANCQTIGGQQPVCGDGVLDPGEDCEGTTCNFTAADGSVIPGVCQACVCIPECQTEGSGCGDDGTSGNNGVCFSGTGGGTGSSLVPVGVHTGVLAQWLAAFAVPGAGFLGLKIRRRFRK